MGETSAMPRDLNSVLRAARCVAATLDYHPLLVTDEGAMSQLTTAGTQVIAGFHRILTDKLELMEELLVRAADLKAERAAVWHVREKVRLGTLALFATLQDADSGIDVEETLLLARDCLEDATPSVR